MMPSLMGRPGGTDAAQTHDSPEEPSDHRAPGADPTKRLRELVKAMSVQIGVLSDPVRESSSRGACMFFSTAQLLDSVSRAAAGYGAGVASVPIPAISSAGINNGSPLVSTIVPRTTVSSSPAPRAVWTTSSS
jgi:hypothetical protein